jgi:hypothetical protein
MGGSGCGAWTLMLTGKPVAAQNDFEMLKLSMRLHPVCLSLHGPIPAERLLACSMPALSDSGFTEFQGFWPRPDD